MTTERPAFETLPTANEIANWFLKEKRREPNVGGDAWWLCRDPNSSCRLLAFVDYDDQEFYLLDITTEQTRDLLWITSGLQGFGCQWRRNPTDSSKDNLYWEYDGIVWMANQIVLHCEAQ